MKSITLNLWSEYKTLISKKLLSMQCVELFDRYLIFAPEGNIIMWEYIIAKDGDTDQIDFETNYKSECNKPLELKEPETGLVKVKPRPVEATLMMQHVYFTTGDDESLDAPDSTWDIDCSTAGTTKVTASPGFSYYIDGGGITLIGSLPTNPLKGRFIMAPNIPAQYGGSIVLVDNLKMIFDNQQFKVDVPPKYVKYYSQNPYANEAQLEITHGENDSVKMEFMARFYK